VLIILKNWHAQSTCAIFSFVNLRESRRGIIMRTIVRLATVVVAAVSVVALFAGPASASRALSITPSRGLITLASSGNWSFSEPGGLEFICTSVRLLISLATEQIPKSSAGRLSEGLIGWMTEGTPEGCTERAFGSSITLIILARKSARETWSPLRYDAFLGTLPNINGVLITMLNFEWEWRIALIGECLYRGSLGNLVALNARLQTERNRFLARSTEEAVRWRGGASCPASLLIRGAGTITPTLTLRLI
jgi:hypothetical protein